MVSTFPVRANLAAYIAWSWANCGILLQPVLQCARLHKLLSSRQNKISLTLCLHPLAKQGCLSGHWNYSVGFIAFRRSDNDLCLSLSCTINILQTLHCRVNSNGFVLQVNVVLAECADLADPHSREKCQQYAELAGIHILKQIFHQPCLLGRRKHTHFPRRLSGQMYSDGRIISRGNPPASSRHTAGKVL